VQVCGVDAPPKAPAAPSCLVLFSSGEASCLSACGHAQAGDATTNGI